MIIRNGRRLAVGMLTGLAFLAPLAARASDPFVHDITDTIMGGVDPHGDSWVSIQHSLAQMAQPFFILRLLLSLTLSVVTASVIAWHPRSANREALAELEERKTLMLLGMVGAAVAELSMINHSLALVIFGIGALLRFRTVLDNPKVTGKAILVVVIGLACGVGAWAMAIFLTAFSWVLIFLLESRTAVRLQIRLSKGVDPEPVFGSAQSLLIARGCHMQSSALNKAKSQLVFLMHVPASLDLNQLKAEIFASLPEPQDAKVDFETT
jgi:hypothetical protein